MIPDSFETYDRFPRLPDGKVDVQALRPVPRKIAMTRVRDPDLHGAATLRDAWRAAFPGIDVNGESDFFALDGNSLMAMRLMNRVQELYGIDPPVTLLFRHPTFGAFERALEHQVRKCSSRARAASSATVHAGFANAQTLARLREQLTDAGYASSRLKVVDDAYALARSLFSAWLRPEGKPFLEHLIGTASILARHGAAFPVVIAGILHAAYTFGELGAAEAGITPAGRRRVQAVVGAEIEAPVHRYARYPWHAHAIASLPGQTAAMSAAERAVVFMRVANELEEATDVQLFSDSSARRLVKQHYLGLSAEVARAMALQVLADEHDGHRRRLALAADRAAEPR